MRITGALRFPPSNEPLRVARVEVTVRDITELDGPAPTVARVELPGLEVPREGSNVPVAIEAELDSNRTYAIRAHADVSGSGVVEVGDLVTTEAHVVRPAGDRTLVLPLHPVAK
jgi:putative lipoprotein